mmetsp:Transcript_27849/g.75775  ORF Transcript_27849/g.75775 Transcript_27849/m.75775 type:complete len:115 (+) Transcript_27849:571-915(+)
MKYMRVGLTLPSKRRVHCHHRFWSNSNTKSTLPLPISSKRVVFETDSKWDSINFFAFSRRAIAECKSAAWKMAAAFATLMDWSIRFSHMVLSRGMQKRSAASNNSMAQSRCMRS